MSQSNNTYFNLLASFAYMGRNPVLAEAFFALHRSGEANVMIDSGAFTAHNARGNFGWLNLDSYCDFLEKYEHQAEKSIMLDVIGDEGQSKRNYEEMVRRGHHPMFVLTMYDKEWSYIRDTMKVNRDCAVSGGTQTKGDWLIKRFQDVMSHTGNQAQIHGLGYVTYPNLFRAPIVSGDSSSWLAQPQRFGALNVFTRSGLKSQLYKEIHSGKKMLPELREQLLRLEITPQQFAKVENHHGACSIGALMSMISYINYQKFAKMHNRRLFLALASKQNLDMLVWVNSNFSRITYDKFIKEFRNDR